MIILEAINESISYINAIMSYLLYIIYLISRLYVNLNISLFLKIIG